VLRILDKALVIVLYKPKSLSGTKNYDCSASSICLPKKAATFVSHSCRSIALCLLVRTQRHVGHFVLQGNQPTIGDSLLVPIGLYERRGHCVAQSRTLDQARRRGIGLSRTRCARARACSAHRDFLSPNRCLAFSTSFSLYIPA
jgi:hypothetical protein